ncbi:MAG: type II toxin-antitoxin system VapC family toxin [Thermoflexales bacterium]|nr:type II toxin-antitoxin system VapC family toxin [Thermoflexales bacterium]
MSTPTQLVVDTSVVIKWFVPEPLSQEARRVLLGYQSGAYRLIAPDLLVAEFGNVLWKKHRFEGLTLEEVAITHTRTVYDSLYLALSLREQCPYVTADERLINAVQTWFPYALWVASWVP